MRRLRPGAFIRRAGLLTGGAALGQAILLAISPVLTRLYTPEAFGIAATYASVLGLVAIVATLRFELAIPLPSDDRTARDLVALSVGASLVLSVALALAWAIVLATRTGAQDFVDQLTAVVWLLPLSTLAVSTYQALNYWAIRRQAYASIARTRVDQALATVFVQLGFGLLSPGALGLILGHVAGQSAGIGTLFRTTFGDASALIAGLSWRGLLHAAGRYRRFALVNVPSGLANALAFALPVILLTTYHGPQVAGWFALAERAIATPLGLITRSAGQVFYADAARLARDDPAALRSSFLRLSVGLAAFAVLPIAIILVAGPWLVTTVFGSDWRPSGTMAQYLALLYFGQVIVNPVAPTLLVLERHGAVLVNDVVRSALVFAAFSIPFRAGASADSSIATYSAVMLATYAATWLMTLFFIGKRIDRRGLRA